MVTHRASKNTCCQVFLFWNAPLVKTQLLKWMLHSAIIITVFLKIGFAMTKICLTNDQLLESPMCHSFVFLRNQNLWWLAALGVAQCNCHCSFFIFETLVLPWQNFAQQMISFWNHSCTTVSSLWFQQPEVVVIVVMKNKEKMTIILLPGGSAYSGEQRMMFARPRVWRPGIFGIYSAPSPSGSSSFLMMGDFARRIRRSMVYGIIVVLVLFLHSNCFWSSRELAGVANPIMATPASFVLDSVFHSGGVLYNLAREHLKIRHDWVLARDHTNLAMDGGFVRDRIDFQEVPRKRK